MSMNIAEIEEPDFAEVLALNELSVPHVNSIGQEQLRWFIDNAAFAKTVRIDSRLAAFMIGLRPGTSYLSKNYRWFCKRFNDFAYVDRIAVYDWARRRGIAELLYTGFAEQEANAPRLTCEVNIRPPNEGSMRFHENYGFRRIATQEIDGGSKEVALMEKPI